jgi:hypothetical protein
MSAAYYAPGTVAWVDLDGVGSFKAMRVASIGGVVWAHSADENGLMLSDENRVSNVRPLVVLDPDNYEAVREVVQQSQYLRPGEIVTPLTEAIQRGLRSLVKPPRIPEPFTIGAVVRAAQVGEVEGSERAWTKFRKNGWIDALDHIREWDDLVDPVLVRDGIEEQS